MPSGSSWSSGVRNQLRSNRALYCDTCGAFNRDQARFCMSCGSGLLANPSPVQAATSLSLTGRLEPQVLLGQRYRILHLLGQGGMGAVYKAMDMRFAGALRAVKELSQHSLNPQEAQAAATAFEHEAMMLAQLNHPNLPHIYDHFNESGRWYLVMDYIDGETLEQRLLQAPENKFSIPVALSIALQLCAVLHYLHTRQPPIIFRDLKPANVMHTADNNIYLIDFGIARFFKPGQSHDTVALGSPGYAAPEQYGRSQTTASADIYSLGVTLYQMLSGYDPTSMPFQLPALQLSPQSGAVDLEALVLQMTEIPVSKRPQSVLEIQQRLQWIEQQVQAALPQQIAHSNVPVMQSTPPPQPVLQAAPATQLLTDSAIVVDQKGGGDYRTINEALRAMKRDTRIIVRPGIYDEELVLDKPVELVGDGSVDLIIIQSFNGSCIEMRTEHAHVRGLMLRGLTGIRGKECFAVDIPKGELLLENCDITSDSLACVAIHNADACPTLRNCTIHDGKQAGILVYEAGQGVIERCTFLRNSFANLAITQGGNPLVRSCSIGQGRDNGLYVYGYGKGTIEDCDITANAMAGVAIEQGGDPLLRSCQVHNGLLSGIYVNKEGRGRIEACEIFANEGANLAIVMAGDPLVQDCKLYKGKQHGVFVSERGKGVIEECEIFGNTLSGVAIAKGGNPLVRSCTLRDNGQHAIFARDHALGKIENCTIRKNRHGSWSISEDSQVTFKGTR